MNTTHDDAVAFCLEQIGVAEPGWRTLVTAAQASTDRPADRLSS